MQNQDLVKVLYKFRDLRLKWVSATRPAWLYAGQLPSKGRYEIKLSIAAKNGAILVGEKEPWCGLRNGLL